LLGESPNSAFTWMNENSVHAVYFTVDKPSKKLQPFIRETQHIECKCFCMGTLICLIEEGACVCSSHKTIERIGGSFKFGSRYKMLMGSAVQNITKIVP
jgi:hypothetical protein